MNKAQQALIKQYKEHYNGWTNAFTFQDFAKDLLAIDPTPDPKKYVVRIAGEGNDPDAVVNDVEYNTEEEAAKPIHRFVQENIIRGVFQILTYNSEKSEVTYKGYNPDNIYKRWVEER